jgi:hypothetical protein
VRPGAALVAALFLSGCGSAPPPTGDVAASPDSLIAAAIDDSIAADEAFREIGPHLADAPAAPQAISPLVRLVPGFRVQLYQSTSLRLAEAFRDNAAVGLGEPVYVEYEAPLYKVRAGNFRLRAEAEAWAALLASRGVHRADVVGTLVDTAAPPGTTSE